MIDRFENNSAGLDAPAAHGFAITPHDANELAEVTRALFVGTAGNLSLILASGAAVTLLNIAGGSILPLRVRQVKATSTTAGAIVGLV
jgi:hypothetical protein